MLLPLRLPAGLPVHVNWRRCCYLQVRFLALLNAASIMKAVTCILFVAFPLALVSPARAGTYLGPQVIVGQFTHNEATSAASENLQFYGLYGLFELWHTERRFDVHAEGIPVWSPLKISTSVGSSSRYAAVGVFDAVVHAAVDPHSRFWVGAGLVDFNDKIAGRVVFRSPFGTIFLPETASSHLSGARYELRAVLPAGPSSFAELQVADMPSLKGAIHLQFDNPAFTAQDRPTTASAFSTLAAYGWNRGKNQYLVGWRSTNYPVNLSPSGQFAFRNTIGGIYFETRFLVGR